MREKHQFSVADYVVFGVSLLVCAGIGIYQACRKKQGAVAKTTASEFLTGGRTFRVLPLTVSLVVSVVSAVTLLGLPAEMYTQGTQYILNVGSGLGIILTTLIFVPLLHPLKLTSMFQYLELRFDSRASRLAGSILEILALLLYGGTALYAPATALEGVTPLPVWLIALSLGAFVTFYTSIGGLVTVVWTDLVQAAVMLAGLIAVTVQGALTVGGLPEIYRLNSEGGRIQGYNFDPDPRTRHTFYGLTAGFAMGGLSFYGASQFTFQRFSATKTTSDAKWTVLLNLPIFYLFHLLLCLTGLIIFAYYSSVGCDPLKNGDIRSANQLLPYFVLDVLGHVPVVPGLFLAALTSGALSTISSVLNSVSALIWEDLLKSRISVSEDTATLLTRLTVALCGGIVVCLTFVADNFGPHIFQVSFALLGASGGPQLGMFLLGALVPWANAKGALCGCVAGLIMTCWITVGAYITKPFQPGLEPASTDLCSSDNYTTNATGMMMSQVVSNVTDGNIETDSILKSTLYSVSYTWYTTVGVVTCLLVGLAVSAVTNTGGPAPPPGLVLPWYDNIKRRLCRCRGRRGSHNITIALDERKPSSTAIGNGLHINSATEQVDETHLLHQEQATRDRATGDAAAASNGNALISSPAPPNPEVMEDTLANAHLLSGASTAHRDLRTADSDPLGNATIRNAPGTYISDQDAGTTNRCVESDSRIPIRDKNQANPDSNPLASATIRNAPETDVVDQCVGTANHGVESESGIRI